MEQDVYLIRMGASDLAQAPLWWPWVLSGLLAGTGLVLWALGRPLAKAILLGVVTLGMATGAWLTAVTMNPDRPAVLFLLVGAALGGLVSGLFARASLTALAGLLLALLTLGWASALLPGTGPDPMLAFSRGRNELTHSIRRVPAAQVADARKGRGDAAPTRPLLHGTAEAIRAGASGLWQSWTGRSGKSMGLLLLLPLLGLAAGVGIAYFRPHWVAAPVTSLLGAMLVLGVLWGWGVGRPKLWLWMAAWTFLGTLGLFFQARLVGWSDPVPETPEEAARPE